MIILVITISFCLFLAVYPFFQKGEKFEVQNYLPLIEEKESIYVSLQEIKEDFYEGKLSKEDYTQLENNLKQKAAARLKKIDKKKKFSDLHSKFKNKDKILEAEIENKKKELKQKISVSETKFCSKCGYKLKAEDNFCSKCGAKFLSLILLFVFVFFSSVSAKIIKGKVINGGTKTSISNLSVSLEILTSEKNNKIVKKTNKQGEYIFDVGDDEKNSYIISTVYQMVDYQSQPFNITKKEKEKKVDLAVYPSTDKDNNLVISMHHIIGVPSKQGFLFNEMILIENSANITYVGKNNLAGKSETLKFSLPQGAKNVQLTEGLMQCCVIIKDGEIISTQPVKPGTKQISFSYLLEPFAEGLFVNTVTFYPTVSLNYFIPQLGFKVKSKIFGEGKVVDMEGKKYLQLSKEMVNKGTLIDFVLTGGKNEIKKSSPQNIFILGIIILVILGGFIFIFIGKEKVMVDKKEDWTAEEIIEKIAKLDLEYEDGSMDKLNYENKRKRLKNILLKLKQNSR